MEYDTGTGYDIDAEDYDVDGYGDDTSNLNGIQRNFINVIKENAGKSSDGENGGSNSDQGKMT